MSACSSLVMKLSGTDEIGHESQRTEPTSSLRPGGIVVDATSTSLVIGGGGADASTGAGAPPSIPLTSSAAAPAAIAATPRTAIRATFMGSCSFVSRYEHGAT